MSLESPSPRPPPKLNTDRIVGVCAMIVGLGSLFIIVYQTYLMRQAQSAAALPYLTIVLTSNDQGAFVNLGNVGVGPALIERVRVRDKAGVLEGDAYDYYLARHPDAAKDGRLSVDRVVPGRLIPAGQNVAMVGRGPDRTDMLRDLLMTFELADVPSNWYENIGVPRSGEPKGVIEVTYTSVYGDRWRVTSDKIVPERL